jgi:hypothetical protein
MTAKPLRLIRASKSRPSGTRSDDDYDVFDGGQHIGRIVWSYAASRERPWVWSITCRFPQSAGDWVRQSAVRRQWRSSRQRGSTTKLATPQVTGQCGPLDYGSQIGSFF